MPHPVRGEISVRFYKRVSQDAAIRLIQGYGLSVKLTLKNNIYIVSVPIGQEKYWIWKFNGQGIVLSADAVDE